MYPVAKGGQVAERLSSEFRSGYSWQNFIGFCSTKDMHTYLVANGARLGRSYIQKSDQETIRKRLAKFYRFMLHKRCA
jgi:hypothetical protein